MPPIRMAARRTFRSATDATRFTSTTPHASSKSPVSPLPASSAGSSQPGAPNSRISKARPGASPGGSETPEERVRRLRAAHEAARKAQVSGVDKAIGTGRRFFDYAHRFTIIGLLGFTAIAGLISVYSVYDMVTYNRQRRAEFIEAQKRIEADELASARLAFIKGTATEDQIRLVEESTARAAEQGTKLPPLLAPASKFKSDSSSSTSTPLSEGQVAATTDAEAATGEEEKKSRSWWPFGSSSSSSTTEATAAEQTSLKDAAVAAVEKERERQQHGGPLDRIGVETAGETKKKGWW
ncbi:hypothetical protein ACRALDRAFT_2038714 [Sodiomyces alcalophilus JCM 7366]|uniref:uncharacterized protein n=1 Tax=Sodiomyces alcalophilus JCM 7366 TaxID=591952 RepID=UPI0039B4B109